MKQETLDKALEIKARIEHIKKIIGFLMVDKHECSPPTRFTSFSITHGDSSPKGASQIELHEGEVEFIKISLLQELGELEKEFERL